MIDWSCINSLLSLPFFFSTERILLGENEGLYMLNLVDEGLFKFSDRDIRKVTQIRVIKDEGLIVLLAGEECVCVCV